MVRFVGRRGWNFDVTAFGSEVHDRIFAGKIYAIEEIVERTLLPRESEVGAETYMAIEWHIGTFVDEGYESVGINVLSEGIDFELKAWFFVLILSSDATTHVYRNGTIEHDPCVADMFDVVDTTFGIDVGVVVADAFGFVVVGDG